VGPAAELDRNGGIEEHDVSGTFLIPGLMDANVHLVMPEPEAVLAYAPGEYDELAVEAAQVALKGGFTTVFDTWGPLQPLRRVRDRVAAGELVGSRVYCAGNIIGNGGPWSADFYQPYGQALNSAVVERINYQWEQGVGSELTWMTAEDVRTAVRGYVANAGIDFVKYSSSAHAHMRFLAFSPACQRAIVEEAHAAGMTAQACTLTPEALRVALDAGVDLIQHVDITGMHRMPRDTVERLAEEQLPCVALLYTERYMESVRADRAVHYGHDWTEVAIVQDDNARELIKAGAKLMYASDGGVFGPDVGTSPWLGLHRDRPDAPFRLGSSHVYWLKAALERGMEPTAALACVTRNIAEAYGLADEIGTIEPGKRGDLLVLEGDPLADVENYTRIAHLVKDGVRVERERLPEHPVLTKEG
jgi:imidazolonepropionase-like amidohydrolase